jgi:hypothetical protein
MIVNPNSVTSLVFTLVALVFTIIPLNLKVKGKIFSINYAIAPPVLTLFLCCTTLIDYKTLVRGLLGPKSPFPADSESNLIPLTVVALFFGLAYTCISADHSNLFKLIAQK